MVHLAFWRSYTNSYCFFVDKRFKRLTENKATARSDNRFCVVVALFGRAAPLQGGASEPDTETSLNASRNVIGHQISSSDSLIRRLNNELTRPLVDRSYS